MANTPQQHYGLDPSKPVVVAIDDDQGITELWEAVLSSINPNIQVAKVYSVAGAQMGGHYEPGALDILFDPSLQIAGVITDNNFPLAANRGPKSTTRNDINTDPARRLEAEEGAAGIMLLRLIKGGKLDLASPRSQKEIGDNPVVEELLAMQNEGRLESYVQERFAGMPIMWNTGAFTEAKLYSVEQAARGERLNLDEPRASLEDATEEFTYRVAGTVEAVQKPVSVGKVSGFFRELLPDRLTLLAQRAGKQPDGEALKSELQVVSEPEAAKDIKRP